MCCREKAKLKQLTLEISERQEEEELNEALANLQRLAILTSRYLQVFCSILFLLKTFPFCLTTVHLYAPPEHYVILLTVLF